jgi:chromosome segregation ATPase
MTDQPSHMDLATDLARLEERLIALTQRFDAAERTREEHRARIEQALTMIERNAQIEQGRRTVLRALGLGIYGLVGAVIGAGVGAITTLWAGR